MTTHRFSLLIKVQRERENNLQAQFIKAQQYYQQAEQKYQGLANYRTEYIQLSQRQGSQGVQGRQYSQYVNFIGKLDQALIQQARVVHQSKAAAEQRKQSWLKIQTKRKALELLVARADSAVMLQQERQQQKLSDEYAGQQFYRRQLTQE
jgi:flagellar FliJ protein